LPLLGTAAPKGNIRFNQINTSATSALVLVFGLGNENIFEKF